MKLIVGLGNPGSKYSKNHHNIGFMMIDEILRKQSFSDISKPKFQGKLYKNKNTLLLKPETFMNESGISVSSVINYYNIEDIIVIYDDLDMTFGALKLKKSGGGSGGHNGIKSIDTHIDTSYIKLKIGIGRSTTGLSVSNWVLKDFAKSKDKCLETIFDKTSKIIDILSMETFTNISSSYNSKDICIK